MGGKKKNGLKNYKKVLKLHGKQRLRCVISQKLHSIEQIHA